MKPKIDIDGLSFFKSQENAMIAPIESSSTASKAYNVDEHFYYHGVLYIVTQPIISGGTISPNTNCVIDILSNDISQNRQKDVYYVTPEMFGAVGDGITDDTNALQAALNSGKMLVSKADATYLTTSSLIIANRHTDIYMQGKINYTGQGFMFEITCTGRVYDCELRFGELNSDTGSIFHITPNNGNNGYVAGVRFSATNVRAISSGYIFKIDSTGWFSENFIEYMNVARGAYFFYMDMTDSSASCSRLTFNEVHIEGVASGVYINSGNHICKGILFNNCRMEEEIDNYYCKIETTVTDYRLAYGVVNIINPALIVKLTDWFIGDVFYYMVTGVGYTQNGAMGIGDGYFYYKGICITPPYLSQTVVTSDVNASTLNYDLANGIGLILLRTSSAITLNITPIPMPIGIIKLPIQCWKNGVITVNVECVSATKTLTYTSENGDEIRWLYIDYGQNKIFIE